MTIAACAKVNFTLEVLGVRPDGYHDLRSVVVPVSLADEVTLEPSDRVTLVMDWCGGRGATALPWRSRGTRDPTGGTRDPTGGTRELVGRAEDNLAVRAVRLMQRVSGRRDGVAITLEKRIPVGGGLGGGSADAAAVMNGLNEMWRLGIPRKELAALGAEIGSDSETMEGILAYVMQMYEWLQTEGGRPYVGTIDGDVLFEAMVERNNRAIRRTGASPIRV